MTGAGRKMGLYQGRIFWSGSVSLVDIVHVQKNNDQDKVGMTIRKDGQTVAATVYLEAQAELSQIEAMADAVKDYDSVKSNIRIQVVNRETNQESLRHCLVCACH